MSEANEEVVGMVVKLAAESTDFQNQMSTLNRQMKVLQSDYKASASSSKDFDKTMEGLSTKSKYLNDAIKTQQSILDAHATKVEKSKQRLSELANEQLSLKSKLDSTKSSYEEVVRLYGEESEQAQKLSAELKELQAQYDKNNDKVNATTRTVDNQTISYNNARATMGNLETQLRETTQSMDQLGNESQQTGQEVNSVGGSTNPFSQFTGGVKDALGQTKVFGVSLGDLGGALTGAIDPTTLLAGAVAGATAAFTQFVMEGLKKAVQAIGEFIKSSMELGESFEAQMSKVEAISGSSNSEMVALTNSAREMGKQSVYSAKEAAQGLEYMALAGWKADESIKGLPNVLNLASAAGMDLGKASDIVTDYLTAFGMQVEDSTRLVDVMAYAMSNSNTNVEQLGEAYKNCAATCTTFGLGVEEATAWLSKMADAGIKGGEAGTALNSVLARLYGQNARTNKAMQEYGMSMYDANGKSKPFTQTMGEMEEKMKTMTDQERNVFLQRVAGTQQLSAFSTMLRATSSEVANFTNQLENSNGTAARMAQIMNDNIAGIKKNINSRVEDIKISISTALEPLYSMVLKTFEMITNSFSNIMRPIGDLINAILSPIKTIYNSIMSIIELFNDKIMPIMNGPLTMITSLLRAIGTIISTICSIAVMGISEVLNALQPIISVIEWISSKIGEFADFIARKMNQVSGTIFTAVDEAKESIKTKSQEAIDILVEKYANANNLTQEEMNKLKSNVQETVDKINDSMSGFGEKPIEEFNNIAEACGLATDTVWSSFEEMYNSIKELDDETFSQIQASAEKYKGEFEAVMGAVDEYESDMLKKKMDKWDETHTHMADSANKYAKRAQYEYEQQEKLANRTADTREKLNKQYTSKLESEFKKQQQIQSNNIVDNTKNYQKDYSEFAKNEENKTRKLQDEANKRSKLNSGNGSTGIISSMFSGIMTGIRGYATGTNNHPGGLAIVGEQGPELANFPKGMSVSTHTDTAGMLKNANTDVVSEISSLRSDVRSLTSMLRSNAMNEAAIIGLK